MSLAVKVPIPSYVCKRSGKGSGSRHCSEDDDDADNDLLREIEGAGKGAREEGSVLCHGRKGKREAEVGGGGRRWLLKGGMGNGGRAGRSRSWRSRE